MAVGVQETLSMILLNFKTGSIMPYFIIPKLAPYVGNKCPYESSSLKPRKTLTENRIMTTLERVSPI